MTEEIIIDKEDKTKKHRNNEIDCLHFCCRKGESGNVLFWCDFYDDHCDNYTGCYYRKYLRLEQENKNLKEEKQAIKSYLGIESKTILERLEELDEWKHNDKLLLWKYHSALEEIKDLCIHYENTNDKCVTNCYAHFIVTDLIQDKINEVLNG